MTIISTETCCVLGSYLYNSLISCVVLAILLTFVISEQLGKHKLLVAILFFATLHIPFAKHLCYHRDSACSARIAIVTIVTIAIMISTLMEILSMTPKVESAVYCHT